MHFRRFPFRKHKQKIIIKKSVNSDNIEREKTNIYKKYIYCCGYNIVKILPQCSYAKNFDLW